MTITDLRLPAQQRPVHDDTVTPESQNLALLEQRLQDPALAGYHDEIREAIHRLTATSMLGA